MEEEKEFCVVFMTLEVERDSNQKGFKARNEKHDRTQLIGTRKEEFWDTQEQAERIGRKIRKREG